MKIGENNVVNECFDSLEEFLTHILSTPQHQRKSSIAYDSSWSGSKDMDEAVKIAREGTDLETVAFEISKIKETSTTSILELVNDVTGAVVDMGAFLEGIPENMIEFPVVDNTKFADIIIDVCESASVSKQELNNKAIATACLVDHLENNGYRVRVRVVAFNLMYRSKEYYNVCVTIKNHKEPLSIGQLTGSMNSSFFRRLIFLAYEKKYNGWVQSGYGRILSDKKQIDQLLESLDETNTVFLPNTTASYAFGCSHNLKNLEEAKQWAEYFSNKALQDGELDQ